MIREERGIFIPAVYFPFLKILLQIQLDSVMYELVYMGICFILSCFRLRIAD